MDLSLTIIQNCLAEHFCLWVDEVLTPLLKNQENIQKFPSCIGKGNLDSGLIKTSPMDGLMAIEKGTTQNCATLGHSDLLLATLGYSGLL